LAAGRETLGAVLARNRDKPPLALVGDGNQLIKPPRALGQYGLRLWQTVLGGYAIDDIGGLELLCLACQALDRAERCREAIDEEGESIHTRGGGIRAHPLLRDELANRAFVVRTLDRLGINTEAIKPPGRPSSPIGWKG
jgi:hypothetical protein